MCFHSRKRDITLHTHKHTHNTHTIKPLFMNIHIKVTSHYRKYLSPDGISLEPTPIYKEPPLPHWEQISLYHWFEPWHREHRIRDQGIIKALKTDYKERVPHHVLAKISTVKSSEEPIKSSNALDAIYWINQTWKDVNPETIQKCLAQGSFGFFGGFDDAGLPDSPE